VIDLGARQHSPVSIPPSAFNLGEMSQNKDLLHIKNKKSFNKHRRWQTQRERPDIAALS
jgi:hypothetical protein